VALALVAVVAGVVAFALAQGGGGAPPLRLPGIRQPAPAGDPFGYVASRQAQLVASATAGSAPVLFAKSPGGVLATAARVARYRPLIDRATVGSGIDPNIVEGIVFLESAGRPNVIAGTDSAAASGLTQILAQTGQSLLGMSIDLARSRRLTRAIAVAYARGATRSIPGLEREREAIDGRFNPSLAVAATVRYLQFAERELGRADLAVVAYHMGVGNLQDVLHDYDNGRPVPYVQLYFDTAPDHRARAYALLSGLGDDSSLYYWRVLAAVQIMHLYRTDRSALSRLAALQTATGSGAEVLHPPDETVLFADPNALRAAYADHTILPLPGDPGRLNLAYDPGMGSLAREVGETPALYRGLRPAALDLLIELAARVRALSGVAAPLIVSSTVTDQRYQSQVGVVDPVGASGYSFEILRQYRSRAQAEAFQAMLDRLQALNLIAWWRDAETIHITVASGASQAIVNGS
jgi:soluble lytic murein transglycosylase-like protein